METGAEEKTTNCHTNREELQYAHILGHLITANMKTANRHWHVPHDKFDLYFTIHLRMKKSNKWTESWKPVILAYRIS